MKSQRTDSIPIFWLTAFVLLLLSAHSFAQERPDARVVSGAEKEATLVWWTTTNIDLSQRILERFEKKYPLIKTELYRAGRGPLLNRILAEALSGRYAWDVLSGSGEMYAPLMERKLVVPYRSPESKAYDKSMMGRDGEWIAYHTNTYVLGFNSRMVKSEQAPRSYEALLDSRWKDGKISLDSDAYPILIGLSHAWGKDKAVGYLKRLAAQNPVVKRGNDERVQLTAAGEYPSGHGLCFGDCPGGAKRRADGGASIGTSGGAGKPATNCRPRAASERSPAFQRLCSVKGRAGDDAERAARTGTGRYRTAGVHFSQGL